MNQGRKTLFAKVDSLGCIFKNLFWQQELVDVLQQEHITNETNMVAIMMFCDVCLPPWSQWSLLQRTVSCRRVCWPPSVFSGYSYSLVDKTAYLFKPK